MSADSPRGHLGQGAIVGGAALLNTSAVIKLVSWSQSYRDIDPIGPILILLGVLGILLSLAVVRFGNFEVALACAVYLAATTVLLLLVTEFELLGYHDGLAAPFSGGTVIAPILGVVFFAAACWLIPPAQRKAQQTPSSGSTAAAGGPESDEPQG